jgi:hydroxymethylbilane synthase
MPTFRIGTRGSQLALFQARTVASLLQERAGAASEIVIIKTSGDRLADASLSEVGGKRLFVKEIEDALLAGEVDLAVHSSKDMPAVLPEGLEIAAVLPREDPRDAVVLPGASGPATLDHVLRHLRNSPRVGTSSVRRIAQLIALLPGAQFQPIRGNLDTRLRKLDDGEFDALVLAAAGLRRLDRGDRISVALPIEQCVPAPGQGIIAVETRAGDAPVRALVERIDDSLAATALAVERAVVRRLGGGCQMPIGAHARVTGTMLEVTGIVVALDGSRSAKAETTGHAADPDAAGVRAAELLLERGAGEILAGVENGHAAVKGLQP